MKNIKQNYQSRKQTEDEFLYAWIDPYKMIRDENDEYVYRIWGLAIICPDELEEFRQNEAFTYMEAIIFCSIIILNIFRHYKAEIFEVVQERYLKKLGDAVELHFIDTPVDYEKYIESRLQFYYQQIKHLQNNGSPARIFSAFYDSEFYYYSEDIPGASDIVEVKKFNKYLNRMFNEANGGCIKICKN